MHCALNRYLLHSPRSVAGPIVLLYHMQVYAQEKGSSARQIFLTLSTNKLYMQQLATSSPAMSGKMACDIATFTLDWLTCTDGIP